MRLSVSLLLGFIFINAAVGVIDFTTGGALGVEPTTGDPGNLDALDPDEIEGTGEDEDLFGLRVGIASQLGSFLSDVAPAVDMLSPHVPNAVLGWVFAPLSLYIALDMMGFLRNGALLQQ